LIRRVRLAVGSSSASQRLDRGEDVVQTGLAGRSRLLALLLLTQFLVVLLDTATVLALPQIQHELGFRTGNLQWVQTSYMIAFGGLLLLAGRCADIFGRRRILVGGLGLFTLTSALCGLAGSPAMLIAGRAGQGVASAFASAAALSIVTVSFTQGRDRDTALGAWGLVSGSAASVGLLFGGVLTEWLGWAWVFFSLLPLSAFGCIASLRLVPPHLGSHGNGRLDVGGALVGTLAVTAFVFAVADSTSSGWISVSVLGGLASSALLVAAFIARERHARTPILPLGVLSTGNVSAGNVATAFFGAILLGVFALTSIYLQEGCGFSAIASGLAMLAMGVMSVLLSVAASRLVGRLGPRTVLAGGLGLLGAGSAALAAVGGGGPSSVLAAFLPASVVFGAGIAATEVSSMITSTDDLGHGDLAGLASGLWSTSLQVGGAVGLAVLATVMTSRAGTASPAAVVSGYRVAALVASGLGAAGAALVLVTVKERAHPSARNA
jgi:MFS family permease